MLTLLVNITAQQLPLVEKRTMDSEQATWVEHSYSIM